MSRCRIVFFFLVAAIISSERPAFASALQAGGGYTGCNNQPASNQLQLQLVSQIDTTRVVEINGVDVRRPSTPFTWIWGDGRNSQGWFPQYHSYPDNHASYTVKVIAHENDGSTDCAQLVVRFTSPNGNAHNRTITETHIPDPLGTRWNENQAGSPAIWTRRGTSNIFDANWENGLVTAVVTVWVQGSNLRMERRNSSDGNDCDYKGSFAHGWATASGTFDCLRWVHGGHWSAKIERALPLKQSANTGHSGIRSVDFQNFDYSSNCFEENGSAKIIHVSNGQANTQDEDFVADKPVFGDLKGDGQEEAVIVLSCHPSGMSPNVVGSEVFIFEMSEDGPKVLAKLPTSYWGERRLAGAKVVNKYLEVSYPDGECNACTDWIVTVNFRWNGAQFVRVGQTRKPYKPS